MARRLSRRTFLRGAGALIALPHLDAMRPAFARSRTAASDVTRMMYVYAPSGMLPQYWIPTGSGADFEFNRIMKPLEPLRRQITVLSGLANEASDDPATGNHSRAVASYLTGAKPKRTEGADVRAGTSVDQIIARAIGGQTRFASIEAACEDSRAVGACDSYSCAYQTVSWKSPTEPLPPEINPRALFERMFGDLDVGADPVQRRNQQDYRKSILDLTLEDARSLQREVGRADQRKLDEYLTSLREFELRLSRAEEGSAAEPPAGLTKPAGIPADYAAHARLMFDLIAVAFQTDLTRVSTFMMAREGGVRPYPEIGIPEAHHPLSHHRNNPDMVEKLAQIECYHLEQFAYFVERLASIEDRDGTLLDKCAITYGAGMGDPNHHDPFMCPTLIAGGASGRLRGGQHLVFPDRTPLTNLHLTMLELAGVPAERFGDSDGKLNFLAGV